MSSDDIVTLPKPKPFLKWVGGKTQLIEEIEQLISNLWSELDEFSYIEPFVGGGAVLFHILANFSQINQVIINDINENLVNAYQVIKENHQQLIELLSTIENQYYQLNSRDDKKQFFLEKRSEFNKHSQKSCPIQKTALLLFLNKTCFNGLYRVNKQGKFNVPFGKYQKPNICNQSNLRAVNHALQKVTILQGDFEKTLDYAPNKTIFYLDPPYKPINSTSTFTSYASEKFCDQDQERLKFFCDQIAKNGHYFILSNSDVKNHDAQNNFFDELYQEYQIKRVKARRNINSKGDKRGEIFELIITNITQTSV